MHDSKVRCEKANEMLFYWTLLQSIPTDDELRKEERTQCKNKIYALLSDSLQVGMDSLLRDGARKEDFIKLVHAMYGDSE